MPGDPRYRGWSRPFCDWSFLTSTATIPLVEQALALRCDRVHPALVIIPDAKPNVDVFTKFLELKDFSFGVDHTPGVDVLHLKPLMQ